RASSAPPPADGQEGRAATGRAAPRYQRAGALKGPGFAERAVYDRIATRPGLAAVAAHPGLNAQRVAVRPTRRQPACPALLFLQLLLADFADPRGRAVVAPRRDRARCARNRCYSDQGPEHPLGRDVVALGSAQVCEPGDRGRTHRLERCDANEIVGLLVEAGSF